MEDINPKKAPGNSGGFVERHQLHHGLCADGNHHHRPVQLHHRSEGGFPEVVIPEISSAPYPGNSRPTSRSSSHALEKEINITGVDEISSTSIKATAPLTSSLISM